jgi:hypothetical protein
MRKGDIIVLTESCKGHEKSQMQDGKVEGNAKKVTSKFQLHGMNG